MQPLQNCARTCHTVQPCPALVTSATLATPATFADPGLGAPQVGDVTLELDLSGIDTAGDHDEGGDTGDVVYTLEVTAN